MRLFSGLDHNSAGLRWRFQQFLIFLLLFLKTKSIFFIFLSLSLYSPLPLAFMADLSSLLCLGALRGSPLHSAITLTLFTLALRSGSIGEPWALCSEPDGVLEGDTDWLVGQPVSSIVNRHTDSNSQEQAAQGRQRKTSRQSELKVQPGCYTTDSTVVIKWGGLHSAHTHARLLYTHACVLWRFCLSCALLVTDANLGEHEINTTGCIIQHAVLK